MFSLWNEKATAKGLLVCSSLTPGRTTKCVQRLNETPKGRDAREYWAEVLDRLLEAPLCLGQKTDWKATFDWFIDPDNHVKLMEGAYVAKPQAAEESAAEVPARTYGMLNPDDECRIMRLVPEGRVPKQLSEGWEFWDSEIESAWEALHREPSGRQSKSLGAECSQGP